LAKHPEKCSPMFWHRTQTSIHVQVWLGWFDWTESTESWTFSLVQIRTCSEPGCGWCNVKAPPDLAKNYNSFRCKCFRTFSPSPIYLAAAEHKKIGHLNLDVGPSSSYCEMITYRFIFRCSASGLPCKISGSLNYFSSSSKIYIIKEDQNWDNSTELQPLTLSVSKHINN
jgi:hypothetical protein